MRNLVLVGNICFCFMYIVNFLIFFGCQWFGVEVLMVNMMILLLEGLYVGNMIVFLSFMEEEIKDIYVNLVFI